MNQGQLITQIGYRYRSASRGFVSSDEIKAELNRSIDRLSATADLENTIVTSTIAFTGDGTYTLPTDFNKPIALYDRANRQTYKLVSKSELIQNENSGLLQYAIRGTNIDIESNIASTTLTLTYYSTNDCASASGTAQKGLTLATDVPLLQSNCHDYFVEDVASVLFRKGGKYTDYKIAKGEADTILAKIFQDNPPRMETVVTKITPYSAIESYN